jgi:polyphosphate:AMP phosphotransferase
MFESAEVDHHISKDDYEAAEAELREQLLDAQLALREGGKQTVLVVIAGVDAAGKGETVQLINTWLDPRHVHSFAFDAPTDEERERPHLWRYWRALPPKGEVGIFFDTWYDAPLTAFIEGEIDAAAFDRELERATRFERMLANEGVVLVKLWFHITKKEQRQRFRELEKHKLTRWRVTKRDWKNLEKYDQIVGAAARAIRESSTEFAPWVVVPGQDERYRAVMVGRALLDALRNDDVTAAPAETNMHPVAAIDGNNPLRALDLSLTIDDDDYDRELEQWQGHLARTLRHARFRKRSLVVVFEGVDAAGKGGAIRRVTAPIDPRHFGVIPIAAPTEEERARPYMWRFWRHLPRRGELVIFDRSWYGRVLVERVEGYCTTADWMRAYSEINDFEEQLVEHGAIVVKLWLHIDMDEQLRRFEERKTSAHKKHKIGPDDWRNREKWDQYERAVVDMIDRTSTESARWNLIEANDKRYSRIAVLRTICRRLDAALRG